MIVVLLMSAIFANILKYGAQSVEGFDGEMDASSNDLSEDMTESTDKKKTGKKSSEDKENTKESYTDRDLDSMKYKESEKMLENQNLLLKNMKDFKPFLDTIQGFTKGFSKSNTE